MTRDHPLVSIVLPTYNRAHFIGQAITSALNQTYQNIQLIVVDDGSTDATSDVIATFDDDRLQYIKLASNVGRSAARNKALAQARGDFIGFLDSDDYFLPNKTEMQLEFFAKNPDFDMVYTASGCFVNEDSPINYFYRAPVSGNIYNEIAFFKPLTITLPTVMLRRKVLDIVTGFDENMARFEDTDFWRRIAKQFKVGAINEVTCHIRSHEDNHISAFDPTSFERAIEYYVKKVLSEDYDVAPLTLQAGSRRLYELYGNALSGVSGASELSAKLIAKGRAQFEPLVSIIIPVYNGENYLKQAIDSALAQTYRNIEVVVVNDGSTDNGATEEVALSYASRIRYISKPNGGCSSALNTAVMAARGEYISWLSHDDLITPTKIEKQIEFLAQQGSPGSCIVYGDYSVFHGNDVKRSDVPAVKMPAVPPEDFRYFLTTHNILHGCSLLIPKRALLDHGLFDETLKTVLDFDLWFKMGKTERYLYLPGVVVHARAHPDQDTNKKRNLHMEEANDLLARFSRELSPAEVESGSKQPLTAGYYIIADTLKRRNFDQAAAGTLLLAEQSVRDAVGLNIDGDEQNGLSVLFSIARSAVAKGIVSPPAGGLGPTAAIQYEGGSTPGLVQGSQYDAGAVVATVLEPEAISEAQTQFSAVGQSIYEGPAFDSAVRRQTGQLFSVVRSISQRIVGNRYFLELAKAATRYPLTKSLALKVMRQLPHTVQDKLSDAWHKYKT